MTVKPLKMTPLSTKPRISGIKECKYVKKQLISIWHELCSIGVTVSVATILKRKGVNNNDKLA